MRIIAPALLGIIVMALSLYAMLDIFATEAKLIRRFSKPVWMVAVVLTTGVGAIAWLLLGRPSNAGWAPGDTRVRERRRFLGPEDRDDWSPPHRAGSPPRSDRVDSARQAHPAGEGGHRPSHPRDSEAARQRRLMEQEAENARRESGEHNDNTEN